MFVISKERVTDMKKIGILTYWGVPNYGAWVQAYALNNVVRSLAKPEDEVYHIAYLNQIHWDSYYKKDIQLYNAFSYSWDEIRHSKEITEQELEDEIYDVFITGSDSIWEFSHNDMGNDIHLIGNNINSKTIISYAASFGETNKEDLLPWVKNGLKKYNKITVRDEHSKKIVDDILNNDNSEIVLDPALLYDFKNDTKLKKPRYKDYIAVYGVEFDEDFIEETIKYARKNNLEIISIGYINKWCDRSIRMLELRTFEWLGLIKNAKCVATSMFHGLMVSISFNKEVKFNQVAYVKNRSQTLLKLLEIEENVSDFGLSIDYSIVNKKLDDLREISIEALKEVL